MKIAREAAKAMRSVDHSIKLVACGSSYYEETGMWVDWNRKVLEGLGDMVSYLSIHGYWSWGSMPDYYTYMGQRAMEFEQKINIPAAEIQTAEAKKNFKNPVYISLDEWGTFGNNLQSVLPIAQCFNSFIRHADVVKMTNFTMMTSLLSSDREKGSYKSPLFYVFKAYSNNCLGNSIDTYVECDTFNTAGFKGIPYLDVTTVYSEKTGTVYINVVNRHKDNAITADIYSSSGTFTGKAEAQLINNTSLTEPFSYDKRDSYAPKSEPVKMDKNKLTFSFPAHSFTQIKVSVKK